ncbi:MAG TPA: FliG C-terminal domain-containing protein [Lacipirellulaceae bacterium]|nr:FliG C-terminal domain-containing protein [Lacipirellulaceae bacterium]
MPNVDVNLRKAAVLLRSLDADTAAMMLGQLSEEEATALHGAMRALGPLESREQADVVAELRRAHVAAKDSIASQVELSLSSSLRHEEYDQSSELSRTVEHSKRFEFLENAPIHSLVPYLARERAQTIAVVLSHLAPERAAAVLAALPQKVQAAAVERLSALGETDPESVSVLERELEAWFAKREGSRAGRGNRRDAMTAILAAADSESRNRIIGNMKARISVRLQTVTPRQTERLRAAVKAASATRQKPTPTNIADTPVVVQSRVSAPRPKPLLPRMAFDDLSELDSRTLAAVLRQVDANVLALALAGSREEMVDRICEPMPKQTAREFRRKLRRLGPTRLSDVETAQQVVAQVAAQQLAERRRARVPSHR